MKYYIAYYRVSTKQQGASGLGLDGQKEAVKRYTENCGACILAEFTEVESGKKNDRQELQKAIAAAKQQGATLLIAKLDRLARNASFIFALRDAGINFICCDMPDANTLTIGIFATLAQYEAELISSRTKAALAVKKAQGFKLGTPKPFDDQAREKSKQVRKQKAIESKVKLSSAAEIIKEAVQLADYKKQSITISAIVEKLNSYNIVTTTGKMWTAENIRPLLSGILQELNLKSLPKFAPAAPAIKGERTPHQPENKAAAAATIIDQRTAGQSYKQIADQLNKAGYKTSREKEFTPIQVQRIFLEYRPGATA